MGSLLRSSLRSRRGTVSLIAVLQIAQALAALLLPTFNATLIDDGVLRGDTGLILRLGGVMVAGTLAQVLCSAVVGALAARTAAAVGHDLRAAVYAKVQSFSSREVGRFGVPSLITRTVGDVQQVQTLVFMGLTGLAATPMIFLGGVVMALRQDLRLSTLLLVALPALSAVLWVILRRLTPLSQATQRGVDQINRLVREQIAGVRVVRAFAAEDRERARFGEANGALMGFAVRAARLTTVMYPAGMLIGNLCGVAVVWYGGHLVDDGVTQVGSLVAFLNYLAVILGSALLATFTVLAAPRARVSALRVREVLETGTEPDTSPADTDPTWRGRMWKGEVEVRDAHMHYPGAEEPVLRGVNLLVRPGETVAVVGSTGSGKTTLLTLVARLLDPTGGRVLLDGTDVASLPPEEPAGVVGLVPQRPYLFSGTIAGNLRYGRPEATDAELWHALEVAQARDFVEALPEGLDTPLGQGGASLSGGQRQRLTVARALVARPRVLLLDDPFSALDPVTERALADALARETRDVAVVLVAQRISSTRHADRLVVLDEGRVAGSGTHEELMASCPAYREIVFSQTGQEVAA
ncbi:ABC transporter ATP-binding protein [Microbispora catharanthi]|uniref:ATP-binding cassette domain-containing protein n=1 Tax=Microbispora catharanthi TaxID=1712871 RepID=A0A5N6C4T7_9ACTN|nr:ABC transporter ATP-binding protein [Microbispora catharanthi]KAB8187742.1 ATP-binding cassette domain-containing protein [Microbispora catharanthi]